MSSILDELELNGKKAQLASFTPQYLNSLRRSGKEIDQIKDLNKTLLIEWNGILLDKYDGRALLAPEELTPSRSDSRQQKSNEKYEEDLCDIYRYEDFMNILGDSYMTPNQDPGARSGSGTEGNLKSVGWCYSNDNKDDNNSENNNMDASEKSSTEVPTKQEPIQSSPDQKELIFKEFRELSTNLNEAMANQADITEEMLRSLVENGDLTLVTQQLKAVNEFIIKLNGKLKEYKETTIIKWRPSIEVPLGMQIPEDEAQNKIIERTAQFFKTANKEQIEKFKEAQASNEKLAFIKSDNALHQYFDFLLKSEQEQAQIIIRQKFNEEKRIHMEKMLQQIKNQEERKKMELLAPKKIIQISDPPFEIKLFIHIVVKLIRKYGAKFEEMLKSEEKGNKNFDFFHEESPLRQYFEDQKAKRTSKSTVYNVNKQEIPTPKSDEEIKNERKRKMKDFLAGLEAKGDIDSRQKNNNDGSKNERENKRQKLV